MPDLEGKLLLDVGCGSGQDAQEYVKRGAIVHGIDLSIREILMAQASGNGSFLQGEMENLPYEDNTFDAVTSFYALQATENVTRAIQEMIRVAKKGSTITILAKTPVRNLLEGHVNDGKSNYFEKRTVTSHIFKRAITLREPGHTQKEYQDPALLRVATLEYFDERSDHPASEQVLGMKYPTYMILQYRKK
ncbi:MAG: class I SAM-dependent methyltransferase [Nanoarchaeota archaeon]